MTDPTPDTSRAPEPPDSWTHLALFCLVAVAILGLVALGYWLGQLLGANA